MLRYKLLRLLAILLFSPLLYATNATPFFSITPCPGTNPKQSFPQGPGTRFMCYKICSNVTRSVTPVMKSITGFSEYPEGTNACTGAPLNPGQCCNDTLVLNLAVIATRVTDLQYCIDGNGLTCSRPTPQNNVDITTTPDPTNFPSTTLSSSTTVIGASVKNTDKNAALTGRPRQFTISNTGSAPAPLVSFLLYEADGTTPATLPEGTTISPKVCGTIATGATCTVTVTPGANATPDGGLTLSVVSENADPVNINLNVIDYGTLFQDGYVFAVFDNDDGNPVIGGTVAQTSPQELFWPFGIIFSSNLNFDCKRSGPGDYNFATECTAYSTFTPLNLYGIYENSTTAAGDKCDGNSDGKCNTQAIWDFYDGQSTPVPRNVYAAGRCSGQFDNHDDWYLPAICQMGFFTSGRDEDSGCGTPDSPKMQNMQQNLEELRTTSREINENIGVYWSSTLSTKDDVDYSFLNPPCYLGDACYAAWAQYFNVRGSDTLNYQTNDGKENTSGVWCVRDIIQSNS